MANATKNNGTTRRTSRDSMSAILRSVPDSAKAGCVNLPDRTTPLSHQLNPVLAWTTAVGAAAVHISQNVPRMSANRFSVRAAHPGWMVDHNGDVVATYSDKASAVADARHRARAERAEIVVTEQKGRVASDERFGRRP